MQRGEVIICGSTGRVLDEDDGGNVKVLVGDGQAGKGVITRASVGGGEGREVTGGEEVRGAGDGGAGLMAAERSASSGEEETVGTSRVRPSSRIEWSLCLFQQGWQMRLLMVTSISVLSCRVKEEREGS